MEVSPKVLQNFFKTEEVKLPEYKRVLDVSFCNIMSKLYLPTNKYVNKITKELYNKNPHNKLVASLAGKKVKEER